MATEVSDRETAVRRALARAGVGAAEFDADLTALGGVGEVSVAGERASVTVTLPVPAAPIRRRLTDGVRAAATGVEGVESAEVAWTARAADSGPEMAFAPGVRNVVAVASGKGGVGKSTVAVNLAAALADAGAAVGLLDADIYGPNTPTMLGIGESGMATTRDDEMVPREAHGVESVSMDFVVDADDPVIWRGPLVDDVLKQLFDDVAWGELDYLVVDMPPGTGDAHLSLVQHLPVAGAVIVTTPQPVATDDAERGLAMFERYGVPVLGLVENMTDFECPDCGSHHEIFGPGGAAELGDRHDVPVVGRLPLDPSVGTRTETDDEAAGLSIPYLGRLSLPRTRQEREQTDRRPPVVLRDDGGEMRDQLRLAATRVAARVNAVATR